MCWISYWNRLTFGVVGLLWSANLAAAIRAIDYVTRECEISTSGALSIECLFEFLIVWFWFDVVQAAGHRFRHGNERIWWRCLLLLDLVFRWQKSCLEFFLIDFTVEAIGNTLGGGWMNNGFSVLCLSQTVFGNVHCRLLRLSRWLLSVHLLLTLALRCGHLFSIGVWNDFLNVDFAWIGVLVFFSAVVIVGFVIVIFEAERIVFRLFGGGDVTWERCH